MEDTDGLKRRIQLFEKEAAELKRENAELKQRNLELERAKGGSAGDDMAVPISEFEETLRRLVQRTAMIVQAEKCVIMVRDRESGDLIARAPAFGMNDNEVKSFRVPVGAGVSGGVFISGEPAIFRNPKEDPHAVQDRLHQMHVRNGVTVPLLIEKRDDQNHIVDRVTIGVLHCFNKRYGGEFIEEDVRLLERLSRNAAAVIANAQMFQEVVEERQKLVHTLESLTAGLILVNTHGRIGQMNAQARAMFGIPEDIHPVGKVYSDIIRHEQCNQIIKKRLEEAEAGTLTSDEEGDSTRKPEEISVRDKDDLEYIFQVHSANVFGDDNAPIGTVYIFNDITDLRNVERMKTEFVSIVSHELRTPLTPMKGFVRTLLDDENEEWYTAEDRREFYNIIDENVDRLGRLINDLLNLSRIEKMGPDSIEMNWENIDIRKAAEMVASLQRGRTDKHTLVVDFDPETIFAETDADKIQNILNNFVNNAIKYSPDGGEVRIIGCQEPPSEAFPTGSVLIGVKDQGLGIPESALKSLFEKFGRITGGKHGSIPGTGIGLYLCKNLIARHG
ncbi:MAG TPA: histidine kinase dimerization/phospho-acceptor domain-containing protein, partial [Chthonomonadaceae bacterium]|nr:histidine kinase dimerization/phospho-acceptor domain-containing protein [Chthonomonadaceae bacterium]